MKENKKEHGSQNQGETTNYGLGGQTTQRKQDEILSGSSSNREHGQQDEHLKKNLSGKDSKLSQDEEDERINRTSLSSESGKSSRH